MPGKKDNSKSKSKAQSFPDVDEALNRLQPEKRLQNERKALRKQITLHCNSIMSLIEEKKSRSTVKALLIESEEFLKRTVAINLELINSVSAQESSDQQTKHTKYLTLIGDTRQAVEDYFEARKDDASSVVTVRSQSNQERLKQLDDAKREAEQAFKLFADKEQEAADAKKAADLASRKLHLLGLGDGSSASSLHDFRDDASITSATHLIKYRHVDNQSDFSASNLGPLPDDWIMDYVNGFSSSQIWNYLSSSLGADLPMYSGEVLQYFAFVDMFKSLVHCTSRSPAEKLAILKSRLRGPCFDAVKHLSGGEDAYKEALRRFKKRFGDRDLMRMTHKLALERLEYRRGDNSAFVQFAEEVRTHLFELGRLGERQNTHLIENVCSKLTHSDRLAWNERRGDAFEYRTVEEFSDWLCNRASSYLNLYSLALEQVNGRQGRNQNSSRFASNSQAPRDKNRTHATTNAIASNEGASQKFGSKKSSPFCFKCDKDGHRLTDCNAFKKMKIVDRVKFVKEHALCFVCCGTKHKSIACHFKKPCVVSGCRLLHHILLHEDEPVPSKSETRSGTSEVVDASTGSTQIESNKIAFCVTQVEVFAADGSIVPATVFIDSGSDSTLIREGFARRLNLEGKNQTLKVDGIGTKCSTYSSQKLDLRLLVGSEVIDITGSTMPKLTHPVPVRDWEALKEKWSHLRDLPLKPSGGEVDILIGLDHRHLSAVLDSRIGSEGQPIAERNKLGWVVSGVIGEQTDTVAVASHSVFTSLAPEEDALLKQVKMLCDSENFGTEYKPEVNLSESEKYAVNYFEANTLKLPVGYESKPIWKPGEPNLHNNYYQALNRFRGLQRRFNRDPKFKKDYFKAMSKYADKNFSRRVEDWDPNDPDQCLLCHSGVYKNQQDQLNGKLRIVFDAACPHRGKSINDCLETGPCLLEPLPSVFLKFCEGEVAWAADVGSFFSKVRIPASDTKYFRYIWKPEGAEEDEIWEKVVLPFGIKPAPYIATAVARKAAVDSGATDTTIEAIKKRMYVDDYASSAHTVTEALEEATGVDTALKSGDFVLEGWVSNSSEFLRRIGAADQPVVDAKILGIGWNVKEDTIQISSGEKKDVTFTRVGLLSKVASLFDPLGIAAPLTVKAKIKLRELCDRGLKWKDEVSEEDKVWWRSWIAKCDELESLHLPRCLFPNDDNIEESELVACCDASKEACAAGVYLRNIYKDGVITTRLLKAATKLAPKTCLSIPKLELNAALLGARLLKSTGACLTHKITRRYLFTDSSSVRNWLRGTPSHYKDFFSSRIGEIQLLTRPEEWRFVPGKLNPADLATRSTLPNETVISPFWIHGPDFLCKPEEEWPKDLPWVAEKEGLRKVKVHQVQATPVDWGAVVISPEDLSQMTEKGSKVHNLILRAQQEVYEDEFKRITTKRKLKTTSQLLALNPYIGEDGLIRLGNRARRAQLPHETLHPPILPGKHPLSEKIVAVIHEENLHMGTDLVLVQSRQKVWITGGRALVKKVRRNCKVCTTERVKAGVQLMADLPSARVEIGYPAFRQTSTDFFGPIEVKTSRNYTKKVWGVIFTCLATRATYSTVVESMSSDHFLLSFRQFVGLYSKPKKLWSDNGTNYVGAERELKEAAQLLYESEGFKEYLKRKAIEWTFQPARTPHFGGAHESMVKSVKKALYRLLKMLADKKTFLTENQLRTFLYEICGLLNTRPLTYASSDPNDFRPICPADFLGRPSAADHPAFDESDEDPRSLYMQVQRYVSLFWDIWKGLYLQSLACRNKWQNKERNFAVGDFCMEMDKSIKRGEWKTGRVVKVFPGEDGLVRAVDFQTDSGTYRRGIQTLCLIDPKPA